VIERIDSPPSVCLGGGKRQGGTEKRKGEKAGDENPGKGEERVRFEVQCSAVQCWRMWYPHTRAC
jgi:hypothetical protein